MLLVEHLLNQELIMDKYEKRLQKVRLLLMTKPETSFFVALAYKLKTEVSEKVPTAGVCGTKVMFNPHFIDTLTDEELLFLYIHELMHLVLMHQERLGDREPVLWNVAGDYVINLPLVEKGFKMPAGGLLNRRFKGMTTEEVYQELLEDNPDMECPMLDLLPSDGDEPTPALTEEEKSQLKEILAEATQTAKMCGSDPGEMCPDIARSIYEIFSTQVDWRHILQRKITGTLKRKTDWLRPNKRMLPHYLPRSKRYGVDNVTLLIDVSGSVSQEELSTYVGEAFYILRTAKPKTVNVFFFSYGVTDKHTVRNHSDLKEVLHKDINSNGGTSLRATLFDLKDHKSDIVVIFSDGDFVLPERSAFNPKTQYIGCFTEILHEESMKELPWTIIKLNVDYY